MSRVQSGSQLERTGSSGNRPPLIPSNGGFTSFATQSHRNAGFCKAPNAGSSAAGGGGSGTAPVPLTCANGEASRFFIFPFKPCCTVKQASLQAPGVPQGATSNSWNGTQPSRRCWMAGVPPAGAYIGQDERQPAPAGRPCPTGVPGCGLNKLQVVLLPDWDFGVWEGSA
jgi:hypothetical protein